MIVKFNQAYKGILANTIMEVEADFAMFVQQAGVATILPTTSQVPLFGPIPSLIGGDYKPLVGGLAVSFLIKNDGADSVALEVKPAGTSAETWVATKFAPGWNVELVREIKQNATVGLTLIRSY